MKRGLFSPFGLAQLGIVVAVGVALWLAYEPWQWKKLKDEARAQFPAVSRISGAELEAWLDRRTDPPLLLDVRTEPEYDTSHLSGARRASASLAELGLEGKLDQPLVIYDQAGFEAPPVALSFIQRGYTRVQVLEGGIYLWANEKRGLVNARGRTNQVRPGNSVHARLLHNAHRAP